MILQIRLKLSIENQAFLKFSLQLHYWQSHYRKLRTFSEVHIMYMARDQMFTDASSHKHW